jgi:hypothetical protein
MTRFVIFLLLLINFSVKAQNIASVKFKKQMVASENFEAISGKILL